MMAYLESLGLKLKTERGQRVFPASDKSSDVIAALTADMKSLGVHIHLKSEVDRLDISDNVFKGLYLKDGKRFREIRLLCVPEASPIRALDPQATVTVLPGRQD